MRKEDILISAQKQANKGKEFETQMHMRSDSLGSAIGLLIGSILLLIEFIVGENINYSVIIIGLSTVGTMCIQNGIKLRNYIRLAFGVILVTLALSVICIFVGKMVGV